MQNKIRVLRAERKWSQAELATRVGVSRNSINSIENGHFDPSLSLAFAIADAFDSKIEDVFQRDDAKKKV
jgi:putative transcriptional regulator